MLLDVTRQTWTAQGPKHAGWQCWSKDSRFLYFLTLYDEPGVFRVSVDNNKLEIGDAFIAAVRSYRGPTFQGWRINL